MLAASVAAGLLGSGGVVWASSRAAFSGATANAGNTWSAGSVELSDNTVGSTVFNATNLVSGAIDSSCVAVSYGGSVDADVRLYLSPANLTGTLAPYVDLRVEAGPGNCAAFAANSTVYTGTLAGFAGSAGGYATGRGSWSAAGHSGASRAYRFSWALRDDNDAQGRTVSAKFTWEAQNR